MRLDHISYASTHDQIIDVIQRLGATLSGTFLDGGIHPRFGTRNFILPLKHKKYLEIVCPIEHPAADSSPFGKIVLKKANEGGGWLSWVVSTDEITKFEKKLNRNSIVGHRKRPDGGELKWKQIGVTDTYNDAQLPFFIEWESTDHPSLDGVATCSIIEIEIAGNENEIIDWIGNDLTEVGEGVEFKFVNQNSNEGISGIVAVTIDSPNGPVRIE